MYCIAVILITNKSGFISLITLPLIEENHLIFVGEGYKASPDAGYCFDVSDNICSLGVVNANFFLQFIEQKTYTYIPTRVNPF